MKIIVIAFALFLAGCEASSGPQEPAYKVRSFALPTGERCHAVTYHRQTQPAGITCNYSKGGK